jgi:hypothetical protein
MLNRQHGRLRVHDSIPAALLFAAWVGRLLFLGFLPCSYRGEIPFVNNNLFDDLCPDSTSEHEKVRLIVIESPEGIMEAM